MLVWLLVHLILYLWLTISLQQTKLAWVAPVGNLDPAFVTMTAKHNLLKHTQCLPRYAFQKVTLCPFKQLSPVSQVMILVPDLEMSLVVLESVQGFGTEVPYREQVGAFVRFLHRRVLRSYCFRATQIPDFAYLYIDWCTHFLSKKVCSTLKLEERLMRQGAHVPLCAKCSSDSVWTEASCCQSVCVQPHTHMHTRTHMHTHEHISVCLCLHGEWK